MATGCSTNAIIHLIAMARRAGVDWGLDDLDAVGHEVPVIANIRPSGKEYLMEDFFYAGGLRALMNELGDKLDHSALTVAGEALRSVAIPAISAGIFGYPLEEATAIIASEAARWASDHPNALHLILLVGYDRAAADGFAAGLAGLPDDPPPG